MPTRTTHPPRVVTPPAPRPRPLVAQDPDRRTPAAYLADLAPRRDEYNGFNLLVGDCRTLEFAYLGNRGDVADAPPSTLVAPDHLDDGARGTVFGLSNATLDHPWPKVLRGKAALREEMRRAAARVDPVAILERVLENRATCVETRENVETRVENVETRVENVETRVENVETRVENVETRVENVETRVENVETRASSLAELPSPFVRPGDAANEPGYGTRCSTVIVVDADGAGATVTERALDAEGRAWQPDATARIEFEGCVRRVRVDDGGCDVCRRLRRRRRV